MQPVADIHLYVRSNRKFGGFISIACALRLTCLLLIAGCAGEKNGSVQRESPNEADSAAGTPSASAEPPNEQQQAWAAMREQMRKAPWVQIDHTYLVFAQAIPREEAGKYSEYLKQTREKDSNMRANGAVGITATDREAAAGRLAKLLAEESDPHNRTIIIWCLRYTEHATVDQTLWDFLGRAKDVDFGVCLDEQGRVVQFRSPFPLAGVEAFKGLVAIKGAEYMLEGAGWERVMARLGKNIDTQPLNIDMQRLRPEGRSRETEKETLERLMRELDEP